MHAEQITRALGGRWHGRYGTARCPAHDDDNPSLSIRDGNVGTLLLKCFAGCQYREILAALTEQLRMRPVASKSCGPEQRFPKTATAVSTEFAARIWSQSSAITGTHAERYLRARAITAPLPISLRFHPQLRHQTGGKLPTMIAKVEQINGTTAAIHRTYLDRYLPKKSDREPVKAMLGPCRGSAVHLRNGTSCLVICEGIETGLSLCDALDEDCSIWAALSASGVAALDLPLAAHFGCSLLIACDGDAAGHRAGQVLAERAARLGWVIELASAPDGKDFNDLATEGAAHV